MLSVNKNDFDELSIFQAKTRIKYILKNHENSINKKNALNI